MAKRKKKSSLEATVAPSNPQRRPRIDTGVEEVENGCIVRISSEGGKDGYESKTFIAPSREAAIQIANSHIASMGKKAKGKKGKKKIPVSKK